MSSRRNAKQAARSGRTDARRAGDATVGILDVLSTGHGHMKVTITPGDKEEIAKAKRMIEDMLKRGFSIFVEMEDGSTRRVKRFNAKRFTYLVDPPDEIPEPEPVAAAPAAKPARKKPYREVPVLGSRSSAVGRSAGG